MDIKGSYINLYYAWTIIDNPGLIGITQPRRVAAVSMAKRVGHELNLPGDEVSYQVNI